jgi:DNA invertase Pin-like site-specific DNA recombinase
MNRGYLRVSTAEQSTEEISLQAQKAKIKAYVKDEAVIFYEDIDSGGGKTREAFKRLINDLEKDDKVLVWRLDRVSRSVLDIVELLRILEQKRVTFVSCMESFDSSSASGKAWVQILNIFAEFEPKVCF